MGSWMIQPRITRNGVTKRAICMDEPTATLIARSILFLYATTMAVTCSAAISQRQKRGLDQHSQR